MQFQRILRMPARGRAVVFVIVGLCLFAWAVPDGTAASPAVVGATFFGPAHAGQPPQSPDVRVLLSAGIVGGRCSDATSHTAVGTACSMEVDAEFPVDGNCSGTGAGLLRYFPSSGEPPAYNIGGIVVITGGRSGSFTGSLLNVATGGVANATVHFLLTGDACNGSGANGSEVGFFAYATS